VSKFFAWAATGRGRLVILGVIGLALVAVPFYEPRDIQTTLILCIAYSIAAIGLTILVGVGGQLSLAHGFFVALGAYGYVVLASKGTPEAFGLGLPPVVAAIGAVLIAAVFGLIFSPVAARLKGLYLGMASLALVFIGGYFFENATAVSGGTSGRPVPAFDVFGLQLSGTKSIFRMGTINFDGISSLWLIGLVAIVLAYIVGQRIVRGRPGQALQLVRDNPSAAAAMGVPVQSMKAQAFVLSSAYAGVGGVFIALATSSLVPSNFGILMSINFLAMIIIGGSGSVGGAIAGASLVTFLPDFVNSLGRNKLIPFVDPTGTNGISGGTLAAIIFGAGVVLILVFEPDGLVGILRRIRARNSSPKK
jgi:branched-chain amino acid transport system permease protein